MTEAGIAPGLLLGCAVLFAAPTALPQLDLRLGSPTLHFVVVTVVAMGALALALTVLVAARRLPDPRTFFLALGFLAMATLFLAHGLGTSPLFRSDSGHGRTEASPAVATEASYEEYGPDSGVGEEYSSEEAYGSGNGESGGTSAGGTAAPTARQIARGKVVGYSALLSILTGSVCFALATRNWGERTARGIVRWRAYLTAAIVTALGGHVAVALWYPEMLAGIPMSQAPINWALGAASTVMLAIAGWRFLQAYRIALLPIQGAMAVGMALLIEAQWMMLFGQLWHLSWWMYHATMGAGFLSCVGALLLQYRMTGDLSAIVEGLFVRQQVSGIRDGDPRALRALSAAVGARDGETAEHIARVGQLSVAMGKRLWLPGDRLEVLHWAGQLHDLGKIGVPGHILRKPGPLTPHEFEVMKIHPVRGWEIARRSGLLAEAAPIIRAHHERLDGSGYPDGLRGDEISMEARIVAVADVWDALTCDRPYRKAMTEQEAVEILLKEAGTRLDAQCVEILFRMSGLQRYLEQVETALKRAA